MSSLPQYNARHMVKQKCENCEDKINSESLHKSKCEVCLVSQYNIDGTVKQKYENCKNMDDNECSCHIQREVDIAWVNSLRSYPKVECCSLWVSPEGDHSYNYGEDTNTLKVSQLPPKEVLSHPLSLHLHSHFGRPTIESKLNLLLTRDPRNLSCPSLDHETRSGLNSHPYYMSMSFEAQGSQSKAQKQITSKSLLRPSSRISLHMSKEQSYPKDLYIAPISQHGSEDYSQSNLQFTRGYMNQKISNPIFTQTLNANCSHSFSYMTSRSTDFLDLIGLFEKPEALLQDPRFQYIPEEVQEAIKFSVAKLSFVEDEINNNPYPLSFETQDSKSTTPHQPLVELAKRRQKNSSNFCSMGKTGMFSLFSKGTKGNIFKLFKETNPVVLESQQHLFLSDKQQSTRSEVSKQTSGVQTNFGSYGLDASIFNKSLKVVDGGSKTKGQLHQAELPPKLKQPSTKEQLEDAFLNDYASHESRLQSLHTSNSFISSHATTPIMSVCNLDENTILPSKVINKTPPAIVQDLKQFLKQIICIPPKAPEVCKEYKDYINEVERSKKHNNKRTKQLTKASKQAKVLPIKRMRNKVLIVERKKKEKVEIKGKKENDHQNTNLLRNFRNPNQKVSLMKQRDVRNVNQLTYAKQVKHSNSMEEQVESLNMYRTFGQARSKKSMKNDANLVNGKQSTSVQMLKTLSSNGQKFRPCKRHYLQSYILKSGIKFPIYDGYLQQYYIQKLQEKMVKAHNEPKLKNIFTSKIPIVSSKDGCLTKNGIDPSKRQSFDFSVLTKSTMAWTNSVVPSYTQVIPQSDMEKMSNDVRSAMEEQNLGTLSKGLSDIMTPSNESFITKLNNERRSGSYSLIETHKPIKNLLIQYEELKNYTDTIFESFIPRASMLEPKQTTTQTCINDQHLEPKSYQVIARCFETDQPLITITRPCEKALAESKSDNQQVESSKAQLLDLSEKEINSISKDFSNSCQSSYQLEQSKGVDNKLQKSMKMDSVIQTSLEEPQQKDSHTSRTQPQSTLSQVVIRSIDEVQSRSPFIVQQQELTPYLEPQSTLSQNIIVSSDQPHRSSCMCSITQQLSSQDNIQPQLCLNQDTQHLSSQYSIQSQDMAMSSDEPQRASYSPLIMQQAQNSPPSRKSSHSSLTIQDKKQDTTLFNIGLQSTLAQKDNMKSSNQSQRSSYSFSSTQEQQRIEQDLSPSNLQPQSVSCLEPSLLNKEHHKQSDSSLIPKVKPDWNSSIVTIAKRSRKSSVIDGSYKRTPMTCKQRSLSYTETQKSWESVSYKNIMESWKNLSNLETQHFLDKNVLGTGSNLKDLTQAASATFTFNGTEDIIPNSVVETKISDFFKSDTENTTFVTTSITSAPISVISSTPKPVMEDAVDILKSQVWNQRRSSLPESKELCYVMSGSSHIQNNARRKSTGQINTSVPSSENYFKRLFRKSRFHLSKFVPFLTSAEMSTTTTGELIIISDSDTDSIFTSAITAESDFQDVNSDLSTYLEVTNSQVGEETIKTMGIELSAELTTDMSSEAHEVLPSIRDESQQSTYLNSSLNALTITKSITDMSSPSTNIHKTGNDTSFATKGSSTTEVSEQKIILQPIFLRREQSKTSQVTSSFQIDDINENIGSLFKANSSYSVIDSSNSTMTSLANNTLARRRTSMASMEHESFLSSDNFSFKSQTNHDVNQEEQSSSRNTSLIHPQGLNVISSPNTIVDQSVNSTDMQSRDVDSSDCTSKTDTSLNMLESVPSMVDISLIPNFKCSSSIITTTIEPHAKAISYQNVPSMNFGLVSNCESFRDTSNGQSSNATDISLGFESNGSKDKIDITSISCILEKNMSFMDIDTSPTSEPKSLENNNEIIYNPTRDLESRKINISLKCDITSYDSSSIETIQEAKNEEAKASKAQLNILHEPENLDVSTIPQLNNSDGSTTPQLNILHEPEDSDASTTTQLNILYKLESSDASTTYSTVDRTLTNLLSTNTKISKSNMKSLDGNFSNKPFLLSKSAYVKHCIACITKNEKMSKLIKYPRVVEDKDENTHLGKILQITFHPIPGDVMIVRKKRQHHLQDSGYVYFYTRQHEKYNWCVGDFILRNDKLYKFNKWNVNKRCKLYQRTHDAHWMLVGLVENPDHMLPLVMKDIQSRLVLLVPRRGDFIIRMRALEGPSQLEAWNCKIKINLGDILARVYIGHVGLRCDPKNTLEGQVELYIYQGKDLSWIFIGRDICKFKDGHDKETKSDM